MLPPNTNRSCRAYEFKTTQIGSPVANWSLAEAATGFIGTQLGTPRASTTHHASGFAGVQFGSQALNTTHHVMGFRSTKIGSATLRTTHHASGVVSTQLGTQKLITTHHAGGFSSVQFGSPALRTTHHATGTRVTMIGMARTIMTQRVESTAPRTRFGGANTARSAWYTTYGTLTAKFGHPTGYQRNNHHAVGFCSTRFGNQSMRQTHRVTHIAPTSRFGRPLLRRTTQC